MTFTQEAVASSDIMAPGGHVGLKHSRAWKRLGPQTYMLLTSVPAAFSNTSSVTSRPAGNWGCCRDRYCRSAAASLSSHIPVPSPLLTAPTRKGVARKVSQSLHSGDPSCSGKAKGADRKPGGGRGPPTGLASALDVYKHREDLADLLTVILVSVASGQTMGKTGAEPF